MRQAQSSRPLKTLLAMFALCLSSWSAPSQAHMMPVWRGTLNLVGDKAYLVLSLPVSALGAQLSEDGQLSQQQLIARRAQIEAKLRQGITIKGPTPATLEHIHLELHQAHQAQAVQAGREFSAMIIARWEYQPQELQLELNLWPEGAAHEPLKLRATISQETSTIAREQVELSPHHPSARLFTRAEQRRAGWLYTQLSLVFWSRAPALL